MAVKRTLWSPDTCGCVIEYEWDDALPIGARIHTAVRSVAVCAGHVGAATPAEHHADLVEENPRKNKAEARLLAAFPAELGMTDAQGKLVLRPDAYSYTITGTRGSRVLHLSLPLLSAAQRAGVQSWCDNNLGAGRVEVTA